RSGGCRHLERLGPYASPEVMGFVDDEELELVSQPLHVAVCALERRDGHGRELVAPVAVPPERTGGEARDLLGPLLNRARVGTTHSVRRPVRAMMAMATWVFPAPVGKTMVPRWPWSSHPSMAASWYGRSSCGRHAAGRWPVEKTSSTTSKSAATRASR